jgi:hypothetical protein
LVFNKLALQSRNLRIISLHLAAPGKRLHLVRLRLAHQAADHVGVNSKIPTRLGGRNAAFPYQLDRLELELSIKCSPSHTSPRLASSL